MHLRAGLQDRAWAGEQDSHFPAPAQAQRAPTSHIRELCPSCLDSSAKLLDEAREGRDFGHECILDGLFLGTARLSAYPKSAITAAEGTRCGRPSPKGYVRKLCEKFRSGVVALEKVGDENDRSDSGSQLSATQRISSAATACVVNIVNWERIRTASAPCRVWFASPKMS
jgi:hypothetical protein